MDSSQPSAAPRARPAQDVGVLAAPRGVERKKTNNAAPPSAPAGEPVYTVLMPPLSFDAGSPEPSPDPSPETILLVREVRLRPLIEFRGHVNPAPAQAALPPAPPVAPAPLESRPPISQPSFLDRLRSFFRRLTSFNQLPRKAAGSVS